MARLFFITSSHLLVLGLGFLLGMYFLPIIAAPQSPTAAQVQSAVGAAAYTAQFQRDLVGSDLMHWGEGTVAVGPRTVSLMGQLAPGPSYKLYLTREFVQNGADFQRVKADAVLLGDVKTFDNFMVAVPDAVNLGHYTGLVVWCESFSRFITAARYR